MLSLLEDMLLLRLIDRRFPRAPIIPLKRNNSGDGVKVRPENCAPRCGACSAVRLSRY